MSKLAYALVPTEDEAWSEAVSSQSAVLSRHKEQAYQHHFLPVSRQPLARTFEELASTWRDQVGFSSSISAITLIPSYQRIIGLGPRVVPYILMDLLRQPDHWFPALQALTGANPVPPSAEGNMTQMAKAWTDWGEEEGLLD